MIEVETVLVLGAGASCDFGFPTGEGLLTHVCDMLRDRNSNKRRLLCELAKEDAIVDRFYNGLARADQPSVDSWLEHNPEFIDIGRWAIAMALLEAESTSNLRPERNWYRLFSRALDASYENFCKNQLKVITFNYDRSLEQYLADTLPYKYKQKSRSACLEKLRSFQLYHIYGSLGPLQWQCVKEEDAVPYGATVDYQTPEARVIVHRAAQNIEILPPERNDILTKRTRTVLRMIGWAKAVYFLGFGFHEANLRRLGMRSCWDPAYRGKKLMGTAHQLEYEALRRVEQASMNDLASHNRNLIQVDIFDFLRRFVSWNELGLPAGLPSYRP